VKLAAGPPERQRKQLALLALLIVAAVAVYLYSPGVTTEVPTQASNTPAAAPREAAPPQAAVPEPLKLAALESVAEETEGLRNPFTFGVPPRPPAPPQAPVRSEPAPVVEAPRPVGPPPRPQIPVKFLGFAEDPSRPGKLVSLSINGVVVLAREGDVVDGKYRLVKVGLESIVMSYLDGQGQQTIRQSGS